MSCEISISPTSFSPISSTPMAHTHTTVQCSMVHWLVCVVVCAGCAVDKLIASRARFTLTLTKTGERERERERGRERPIGTETVTRCQGPIVSGVQSTVSSSSFLLLLLLFFFFSHLGDGDGENRRLSIFFFFCGVYTRYYTHCRVQTHHIGATQPKDVTEQQ